MTSLPDQAANLPFFLPIFSMIPFPYGVLSKANTAFSQAFEFSSLSSAHLP